jgi:ATP-dependent DNA helicase RecG
MQGFWLIFRTSELTALKFPGPVTAMLPCAIHIGLMSRKNHWGYFFVSFDRLRRQFPLPFKLTTEGLATEDYPQLNAIREALVNFLMHADYFSPAKLRIRVFDCRIEFFNPGALPKPLDKMMAEDISMPGNPVIAKLFRVVKLAENAG